MFELNLGAGERDDLRRGLHDRVHAHDDLVDRAERLLEVLQVAGAPLEARDGVGQAVRRLVERRSEDGVDPAADLVSSLDEEHHLLPRGRPGGGPRLGDDPVGEIVPSVVQRREHVVSKAHDLPPPRTAFLAAATSPSTSPSSPSNAGSAGDWSFPSALLSTSSAAPSFWTASKSAAVCRRVASRSFVQRCAMSASSSAWRALSSLDTFPLAYLSARTLSTVPSAFPVSISHS